MTTPCPFLFPSSSTLNWGPIVWDLCSFLLSLKLGLLHPGLLLLDGLWFPSLHCMRELFAFFLNSLATGHNLDQGSYKRTQILYFQDHLPDMQPHTVMAISPSISRVGTISVYVKAFNPDPLNSFKLEFNSLLKCTDLGKVLACFVSLAIVPTTSLHFPQESWTKKEEVAQKMKQRKCREGLYFYWFVVGTQSRFWCKNLFSNY